MYLRNRVSFEGVFRVGERIEVEDDVRGQVGVMGGFEEMQAMDAMFEIICEICTRSPDALTVLDGTSGSGWRGRSNDLQLMGSNVGVDGGQLTDVAPSYCNNMLVFNR